jgi:23S rRNA (uracil1939-C5)-methyltransferase
VTFVVQRERVSSLAPLERAAHDLMNALPEVAGVAVNFHEGDAPQVLGAETQTLAGASSAADRLGASVHFATFGSFVQAHRGQAARVHALVAEEIGLARARTEGRRLRVLDLYGGSGAIALGLAAAGASVRLVESFAPAVAQVRAAAESQSLDVQAECADVAAALRALVAERARFDAVIINPPRRGTSPTAREWLARLQPPIIAYVSCDPETLARDLDHFARLGYAATTLRPLDMIPLTDEVETVAVMRRAGTPLPRVLHEDAELLIVDKGAHEPTTPQGEYAGSLLARVRRIPGAEEAVPLHRLDVGTSGLVMFARRPELVAKWQRVLAAATTRKIYVAAVRGMTPSKGAITRDLREDGKVYAARTRYRRLAVASGHSVLRVVPEQGRTHQIRRHLAAIGHPVLGDERYGHATTNRYFEEKNGLDRTFLHCVRFELDHPDTPGRLIVEAPLPGDLRAVLERTGGPGTLRFLDHKNALGTSGTSHLPPGPDEVVHDRGSMLDVDGGSPTLHPELTGDDEEGSQSGGF